MTKRKIVHGGMKRVPLYEYENIGNAAKLIKKIGSHNFNHENTVETRAGEVLEGMRHVPLTSYWARSALKQPGAEGAAAAPKSVRLNMANTRAQIEQLSAYKNQLETIINEFEKGKPIEHLQPLRNIFHDAVQTFNKRYGIRGGIRTRDDIIPIIHSINGQVKAILEEGYMRPTETRGMPHMVRNAETKTQNPRNTAITINKIYFLYGDVFIANKYYNERV
jgi:hypothetical protein